MGEITAFVPGVDVVEEVAMVHLHPASIGRIQVAHRAVIESQRLLDDTVCTILEAMGVTGEVTAINYETGQVTYRPGEGLRPGKE